jgi:hypothetical protein
MSKPTKRYDLCAGRPYGDDKKHWINIGRGTEWDDGSISVELFAAPVGNWFDGKLQLFEQKPKDGDKPQRQERPARGARSGEPDDSIPF